MPLCLQHKVYAQVGVDPTFNEKLFYPEDANALVILNTYNNQESGTLNIAASSTQSLNFGIIQAAYGAYIKVSGPCTLSINGGAAISLGADNQPAKFFIQASLTALALTAPAGSANLTGSYVIWGDLVS